MTTATHPGGFPRSLAQPRWTAAERNFWLGAALTTVLVVLFKGAWWVEREWLGRTHETRLVAEASEAAMRYFTIPHIIIGFLFSATAIRNRTPVKRIWLAGLTLFGVASCFVYYKYDHSTPRVTAIAVYAYFLVHEMRDEAYFYSLLGGTPANVDKARYLTLSRGLIALFLLGVGVIAWPLLAYGVFHKADQAAPDLTPMTRAIAAFAPLLAWAAGVHWFLRSQARDMAGGTRELLRTYAPLLRLLGGVLLFLLMAMVLIQRPYALILLHVSVWYVFTMRMLRARPSAQPATTVWGWMRTTPLGFNVLHVGIALVLLAIGTVWTYKFGASGWLWYLLSPKVFLYWTIMHITVSFVPR